MDTQSTYAASAVSKLKGVNELSQALDCHPVLAKLLIDRGLVTPEEAQFFLTPTFEHLKNPFDLKDMEIGVKRIYRAVQNKEKILIFGDFDADGVTATSLVYEFLTHVEADVTWYIPHRIKEGYSLHPPHIEKAVAMSVDLIITVDCGISAHEAIQAANAEDIDVIITDHHEPSDTLPSSLAAINPKRSDCTAGLDYLAGVGVGFFLVMGLRKYFRDKEFWGEIEEPSLVSYLDLFVIGTIGDMVPLIKDNRVLCLAGLRQIQKGHRPGIFSLAQTARLDVKQLDSDDISFKIVPRINAAGRMSHARICVSHLTAPSLSDARTSAALLDDLNLRRQQVEKEIVIDIEHRLVRDPSLLDENFLMLWDKKWAPSVLGIAASRLSRKYNCPVVLLSLTDGVATGSCRSINQINIHQALTANHKLMEKFGGHAMAAGLTLKEENLNTLKSDLNEYLETHYTDKDYHKAIQVDAELDIKEITLELAKQINMLMPFGTANPEPVFMCKNLWVASSHILGNCHRKMVFKGEAPGHSVEALHFNLPDIRDLPAYYDKVVFKLKINKFKTHTPQMIIQEI